MNTLRETSDTLQFALYMTSPAMYSFLSEILCELDPDTLLFSMYLDPLAVYKKSRFIGIMFRREKYEF